MNKQRREKIRQLKTQIDLIKTDLKKVSSELYSILSEEQDAFDNMPEGLQEMCEKPTPLGVVWIAQIMCM